MTGWFLIVGSALVLAACATALVAAAVESGVSRAEILSYAAVFVAPTALAVLIVGLLEVWG